jgi:UDP-2-acetamido-2,6-beta-L-arabino-hexul-4-ose reductase
MSALVAASGANGFLGWHTQVRSRAQGRGNVRPVPLGDVVELDDVVAALSGAERVLHLAGVNRGDPKLVRRVNVKLAAQLAEGLRRADSRPEVLLYANSTQAGSGGSYGDAKQEAADILRACAEHIGAEFVDLRLPNLFGEHGRPFYNSVVATFAHQLAHAGDATVEVDRPLTLLHVQKAAEVLLNGRSGTDFILRGSCMTVGELRAVMGHFADVYRLGEIPELENAFQVALFNTYRSFTFPDQFPGRLRSSRDPRGAFVEVVRCRSGPGQTSFSTTSPGVTRGQHFHLSKIERFVVVSGHARISLRRVLRDEVITFEVRGSDPVFLDMPTMWAHNIVNIGADEMHTMFWTNDLYDPVLPDTYQEPV